LRVTLNYGTTGLDLDLAGINATVLRPQATRMAIARTVAPSDPVISHYV